MIQFSEKAKAEFDELIKHYPDKQAALLPVLYLAQSEFGYISPEVTDYLAGLMDLSSAQIYSVASFYPMFHKRPPGKYHIVVCRNITCSMMGSEEIIDYIRSRLGIEVGETTPDGRFTLDLIECLASCDTAPTMQINNRYHEELTVEKVKEILDKLESS